MPDFATLKPVDDQPDFATLKPADQLYSNMAAPKKDLFDTVGGAAKSFTDAIGLRGATDTLGTNIANMLYTGLMERTGAPLTTLKQNIGAGAQIGATTAMPGKAALGVGANIALGAAQGATIGAGKAASENQSTNDILKQSAIGGAVGGAVTGMTALAGKFLERVGEKIQYSIIKPTQADIKDGFNIGTVQKYNLGGPLPQVFSKTEKQLDSLTAQLNDKLAASNEHINLNEVFQQTVDELGSKKKLFSFGATGKQSAALEELGNEISNVGSDLTIPDAQVVKRAAGHFGAWQYGARDPESTAREQVYNVFYTKLKEAIEKASPAGVKEINQQMSELIPVLNAVIRRIPIAERNNALSLTDIISLTGSAIEPRALGLTMVNLLSKSGTAANILSKVGPRMESAAPAIGTAAAAVEQASVPTTPQTQDQQSIIPTTSPNPITEQFKANPDGTITGPPIFGDQPVTMGLPAGVGSVQSTALKAEIKTLGAQINKMIRARDFGMAAKLKARMDSLKTALSKLKK